MRHSVVLDAPLLEAGNSNFVKIARVHGPIFSAMLTEPLTRHDP